MEVITINKLSNNDLNLLNEIINFIFIKQNTKNYKFNYFPKTLLEIRKKVKNKNVYYQKENELNSIIVVNDDKILFCYFSSIEFFKNNILFLKKHKLIIDLNNELFNYFNILQIKTNIYYKIRLTKINNIKNNNYIGKVISLPSYLKEEYEEIHKELINYNNKTLILIKNNELIGYLDYYKNIIINIYSVEKNDNLLCSLTLLIKSYLKNENCSYINYIVEEKELSTFLKLGFEIIEKECVII